MLFTVCGPQVDTLIYCWRLSAQRSLKNLDPKVHLPLCIAECEHASFCNGSCWRCRWWQTGTRWDRCTTATRCESIQQYEIIFKGKLKRVRNTFRSNIITLHKSSPCHPLFLLPLIVWSVMSFKNWLTSVLVCVDESTSNAFVRKLM